MLSFVQPGDQLAVFIRRSSEGQFTRVGNAVAVDHGPFCNSGCFCGYLSRCFRRSLCRRFGGSLRGSFSRNFRRCLGRSFGGCFCRSFRRSLCRSFRRCLGGGFSRENILIIIHRCGAGLDVIPCVTVLNGQHGDEFAHHVAGMSFRFNQCPVLTGCVGQCIDQVDHGIRSQFAVFSGILAGLLAIVDLFRDHAVAVDHFTHRHNRSFRRRRCRYFGGCFCRRFGRS